MTEAINNGVPHAIQRDVVATVGAETVNPELIDGEEPSSTFIRGGTTTLGGSVPMITNDERDHTSAYKAGTSTSDNIERDDNRSSEVNESGVIAPHELQKFDEVDNLLKSSAIDSQQKQSQDVENGMMFNEPINFYTGYSNDHSVADPN